VTVMPDARIACVAFTSVHGHRAVAAMGKTLELDGGKRVLCKQEGGRAHKSDEPLFHTIPHNSSKKQNARRIAANMPKLPERRKIESSLCVMLVEPDARGLPTFIASDCYLQWLVGNVLPVFYHIEGVAQRQ
jgi:hypothetical protein